MTQNTGNLCGHDIDVVKYGISKVNSAMATNISNINYAMVLCTLRQLILMTWNNRIYTLFSVVQKDINQIDILCIYLNT